MIRHIHSLGFNVQAQLSPKGILTPKSSDYKSVPLRVFSVISGKCQLLMVQEAIIPTQKIGQGKKGKPVNETKY